MARYNRRDLFAHWVKSDEPAQRPCEHACCRGMRPHPENYPVIKRNRYLKYSSYDEITGYWDRHQSDSAQDERIRAQILAEMNRRDIRDERRAAAEERRTARNTARRMERAEAIERAWADAERATKGNMLNRRGREAHVNERTLFTGPESRARKYASEELLNHWEHHPRPTQAYFEGRDARIGYGRHIGVRGRVTSEESDWRDRFEQGQAALASAV